MVQGRMTLKRQRQGQLPQEQNRFEQEEEEQEEEEEDDEDEQQQRQRQGGASAGPRVHDVTIATSWRWRSSGGLGLVATCLLFAIGYWTDLRPQFPKSHNTDTSTSTSTITIAVEDGGGEGTPLRNSSSSSSSGGGALAHQNQNSNSSSSSKNTSKAINASSATGKFDFLPQILVDAGKYDPLRDFQNEAGRIPTFWGLRQQESTPSSFSNLDNNSLSASLAATTDTTTTTATRQLKTWGPCYRPASNSTVDNGTDWNSVIERLQKSNSSNNTDASSFLYSKEPFKKSKDDSVEGLCRPGFLIIGGGKCGTSSLYHYLTEHPRVLPAVEKQIHYFKYYFNRPLPWYYRHYPTTENFLASGALMTGEASPGYIPYPEVPMNIYQTYQADGDFPKVIAMGRNPIDRAWSSYRYSYATTLFTHMKDGRFAPRIPPNGTNDYYEQFLFSFEDLLKAELQTLRECLEEPYYTVAAAVGNNNSSSSSSNSSTIQETMGSMATRNKWSRESWAVQFMDRRAAAGLPPLQDIHGVCYGTPVSYAIPRRQWTSLIAAQPDKIITQDVALWTASMIGRGLYLFPLEWWYEVFPAEYLYFVCMEEDLGDMSGRGMNALASYLGLPSFDFSPVLSQGAYNVGGHDGYDVQVDWETVKRDRESGNGDNSNDSNSNQNNNKGNLLTRIDIPLSKEFRAELEDFLRPYNDRLFAMVGRRCNW